MEERLYNVIDLSHDGKRIAAHVGDVNDYVWIVDTERNEGRKLATPGAGFPLWSLDGETLAVSVRAASGEALFAQPLQSVAGAEKLLDGVSNPSSWSPDRSFLGASAWEEWTIVFLDTETGEVTEWAREGDTMWGPEFSPDGRWVAYTSDQTGQFEIWLRSFPDGDEARQVSTDGGVEPIWKERTGELFYRVANRWMVTRVTTSPELTWEPPRLVFETEDFIDTKGRSYDVTPDGQRLLVVKRTRPPGRDAIRIVVGALGGTDSGE